MQEDRAAVIEQQDAAMQAALSRTRHKQEPSPLAQIEIGKFFRKVVGILTR